MNTDYYEKYTFKKRFKKSIKQMRQILAIRWVNNTLLVLCLAVFIYSVWSIYIWYDENKRTAIENQNTISAAGVDSNMEDSPDGLVIAPLPEDLPEVPDEPVDFTKVKYMTTDFTDLLTQNPDTIGWVRMNGTNINYPVVQRKGAADNDYYLTHSFNNSVNKAGWVFGDFRNNFTTFDKNNIIYGHARLDNSMFGSLAFCLKDWWYKKNENHIVRFNTLYDQTVWQVFSVYVVPYENYYIQTTFDSDTEFLNFINTIKGRSQVKVFNVGLTAKDKILTLSTCRGPEKRLVAHCKLIKTTYNKIPNPAAVSGVSSKASSSLISGSSSSR